MGIAKQLCNNFVTHYKEMPIAMVGYNIDQKNKSISCNITAVISITQIAYCFNIK